MASNFYAIPQVNELDDSVSVYQSLFNSAPNVILVVENSGYKILEANPRFFELFGFSRDEVKSMRISDLFVDANFKVDLNSKDLSAFYVNNREHEHGNVGNELPNDFVSYARNQLGERFLARFKCVNVDQHPHLKLVYINRADGFIESLHWRSIVENLPYMALLINRQGEIIYANHAEPYNLQNVVGSLATNYLPMGAKATFAQKLENVFANSIPVSFETEAYALDEVRIFRVNITPIADDSSSNPDFVLLIAQDVTEIVSNQIEKQEIDNAFSKLQHVAHIGSWSLELATNQVQWSDEMYEIYGVERESFDGQYWDVIFSTIHPDDSKKLNSIIAKIQRMRDEDWSWEFRIHRQSDGKLRYLWGGGEYVLDSNGQIHKAIGFVQDITDYKLMQRGLSEIARCSAEGGGMALINQLLSCFSSTTGLDIVYIATISPDQKSLHTKLLIDRGSRLENFSYELAGTPCERLIEQSDLSISGNVHELFPHDELLLEMGIRSYVGTALRDINNNVFAILVALHREKLEYPDIVKTLLQITATRVASEMSRMETQQALENSELHLRNAITSAEFVTWEWDLQSNTLAWSENVSELLAQTPSDFSDYQKLVHPQDISNVLQSIETSLREGSALQVEHRIVGRGGDEKWIRMKGRFHKSGEDKAIKLMGVISDVTAEKNALIAKRMILSRFAMHLQQTPLGVIELDRDCNVVEWNPAAEKIFGYKKSEVLGRFVIDFIVPHTVKPTVSSIWDSLLSNVGGRRIVHKNITKSGAIINCDWHNTPLIDEDNQVIGVACIVEDITHRISIEEELKSHREHLEELVDQRTREMKRINRELQAFSYSVSHDLRAPLRAIDGFSQILLEEYAPVLDETANSYLNRVIKGAQNMAKLIDDLLKLSRISREQVNKQNIDLSGLASTVVEKLSQNYPERIIQTDIEGNLTALADKGLIQVALENLLGNAWKYSSIRPNAKVEFKKIREDGKECVYAIIDNGVGFDMKFVDKLFGAFQRLHEKDKQFEGSGIGLATVQRIIRLHGGKVWAEGKVNQGASFYFSLPLANGTNASILSNNRAKQSSLAIENND